MLEAPFASATAAVVKARITSITPTWHYAVQGNATLGHPLHDADGGYLLVPVRTGIRLTTGVEFAERDAPPNPIQLARDEPFARELFPLEERREPAPWLGSRPCLPDMVPVISATLLT